MHEKFGKILISTENCGSISEDAHALAERYGKEICGNLSSFTAGFCDWNLLLSEQGGPFHNRSEKTVACAGVVYEDKSKGCYAPVIYDTYEKRLIYTPIYYYIGHFSKFVKRGALRVATTKYDERIYVLGFRNPDGELVTVVMNTADIAMPAVIRHNGVCTRLDMEPHSIFTAII